MKPGYKMMIAQTAGVTRGRRNENRRMIGFDRDEMRERTREYPIPNDNNDPNGRADSPRREYMPYPPLKREEAYGANFMAYAPERAYPAYNYMPHENMMQDGNKYGDIYASGTIYAPGAMNKPNGSRMENKSHINEQNARKWVRKMDGGEVFKIEQTEQQRLTHCPECEKWEFYVAMNAMHSDHFESMMKLGIDKPEAYAMFAKDFINDKDAVDDKTIKYMEYIAK